MKRAIVLLSGGLDSATAMWKVKDQYTQIYALTFAYGAKDEKVMLKAAKKLSKLAGAKHIVISLPWLEGFSKTAGSALVSEKDVPSLGEEDLNDSVKAKATAKAVWVPARNLVFLSIAASFAEALGGRADIITGFDREEAATFPDNSQEFVERMNRALELAVLAKGIRIVAPIVHLNKGDIAGLASELGLPVEYTTSCYNPCGIDRHGRPIHCGACESCMRRKRGFKSVGMDRTVYRRV